MNELDRSLILGAANNVTIERILVEKFEWREFKMTMGCTVLDENEEEVYGVNTIYTNNMVLLRSLTWRPTVGNMDGVSNDNFIDINGNTFTGRLYSRISTAYAESYAASILGYLSAIYMSVDGATLSRDDYALPDDVISMSYNIVQNATVYDNAISSILHTYYTNDTGKTITVNKILITGNIGTSSTNNEALLFEELLDEPVYIKPGKYWARDYSFRLSC